MVQKRKRRHGLTHSSHAAFFLGGGKETSIDITDGDVDLHVNLAGLGKIESSVQ
jgi:hypothetical protein